MNKKNKEIKVWPANENSWKVRVVQTKNKDKYLEKSKKKKKKKKKKKNEERSE